MHLNKISCIPLEDHYIFEMAAITGCYCGWTMTMDFAMDQCLQSDACQSQSHSLGVDWIVK